MNQHTSFINRLSKADRINIAVMVTLWIFMAILVNPLGDFPVIDDWVYGLAVKSILEKGDFRLPSPASANVFTQAFWGALFCLPFGFSFTALRFSTLTLGLIGVLATYALLREIKASPKIALFGALLIVVNPIYFGLSNTFMTDVPFYAFWVLSFYFLIHGLKRDANLQIVIGIAFSYVALLIRQVGIIIPLAFGGAYLVKKGANLQNFIKAFSPVLLGGFIQFFYVRWLLITGRTPPTQIDNPQYRGLVKNLSNLSILFSKNSSHSTLFILIYMGALVFPLLIIIFSNRLKQVASQSKKRLLLSILSAFVISVMGWLLLRYKQLMPLLCCHLDFNFGFGPLSHLRQPLEPLLGSLKRGRLWLFESPEIPFTLKLFWALMTIIGVIGAALLLYYLWLTILEIFKQNKSPKYLNILVVSAIISYLCLVLASILMERYLLPLLPLFMITALLAIKDIKRLSAGKKMTAFVLSIILIYGGFTVGATHDYLSRGRTMWQSLQDLVQKDGISPSKINGGYEFSGWYSYNLFNDREKPNKRWWADDNEYIISSGSMAGYQEVKRYPFQRWLSLSQGNILVLHKIKRTNSTEP